MPDRCRPGSAAIAATTRCIRSTRPVTPILANGSPNPAAQESSSPDPRKKKSEVAHGAEVGIGRSGLGTTEVQSQPQGHEVDRDPIRLKSWTTESSTLERLHRKPLMPQEFPDATVHVAAEFGRAQPRGSLITSGNTPASIPGSVLDFGVTACRPESSAPPHLRRYSHAPRERTPQ